MKRNDSKIEAAWAELRQDVINEKRRLSKKYGAKRWPRNEYELALIFLEDELGKEENVTNWEAIDLVSLEIDDAAKIPKKLFQQEAYEKVVRMLNTVYSSDEEEEELPDAEEEEIESMSELEEELAFLENLSAYSVDDDKPDEIEIADIKNAITNKFRKWKTSITSMI